MRIVIDMQGAQTESRFRGIGRYTMSLAQAIVRSRGEHEIILALSGLFPDTIEPIRAAFDGQMPQENIRVWHAPGPVRECEPGNEWRREVAERIREAFLTSLRPDVVYVSSLFEGYVDDAVTSVGIFASQIPTVVTLYDLIPLLNPKVFLSPNPGYELYYQRKIEHLKRANQWLAISESAAGEGCTALNLPSNAVVNISTACDAVFRCMEVSEAERQQLLTRFGITLPFVLSAGDSNERKNLSRLISAYARLSPELRGAHKLVLAGKVSKDDVRRLQYSSKAAGLREGELVFTGYVTDEELVMFYNLCAVFVFPSYHEGFGLPVLEAMSCGAAVIGANTTSVPEVIGRQDALFDPYDDEAISKKLAEVLGNDALRAELAAHGLKQAKKFSWEDSARRAIAAFEKLHSATTSRIEKYNLANLLPRLVQDVAKAVPPNIPDPELFNLAHALSRIHTDAAPKQLLVDISELAQRDVGTGVQRVTRSILGELLKRAPDGFVVRPVFATVESKGYFYARQFTAQFQGLCSDQQDELLDYRPGDLFLGLDLQHHTTRVQEHYLSSMHRDGVSIYFVVYDLLPIHFPHYWPPQHSVDKVHAEWLHVISQFDGAICISRAVANELTDWQRARGLKRLRPFKTGWFHLGADLENSAPTRGLPDDANHVLEELARRPTFLTVGTVEPRKGQVQVLGAFELLWREGIDANLVIVGRQGWMVESLVERLSQHSELNKRLFWLEGISDEYLEKVYGASTCLIAASEGEGFGLPLIEAAQHKLSIIARDIPVFREVAGKHAFYFSGTDPQKLVEAISNWLMLKAKGKTPDSTNMPWLTWQQSTQQLLEAILPNLLHY
ncbi:MAG: glycosyltransferase family 1 protein [Deltaproteobacteria bacterium]|nr:glycosyltransferase family 1 protein [Deltaproteobacteria bacterium]